MKLIKTHKTNPILGHPPADVERWDLGDGYNISVHIRKEACTIGVRAPKKNITYELAKYLDVDTDIKKLTHWNPNREEELYLIMGIDCVSLVYKKPENYKELLEKIEIIVNEHFKKIN